MKVKAFLPGPPAAGTALGADAVAALTQDGRTQGQDKEGLA